MQTRAPHQLVGDTFGLYRRYPLLFLVLASAVIVPYEVILLVATGDGPFAQSSLSATVSLLLTGADFALIGPLVSALHVHAVATAREGHDPRIGSVARQGLRVLPIVAAASIMSWIGTTLGFLALFVPGVILTLRWFVVAQAAAIEHEGWLPALRRSAHLTSGHYGYVFLLSIYVGLVIFVPAFLVGLAFGDDSTTVISFSVGVLVQIFVWSFGALVTALAYFELRRRFESTASEPPAATPRQDADPWDLDEFSAEVRPSGWYVEPADPGRMRRWEAGEPPRWGETKPTPPEIRSAWEEKHRGGSAESNR